MLWHLTKPKIHDRAHCKALEFPRKESEGSRLNLTEWLERYLYTYIHDNLFCVFLVLLHEWILRIATQQRKFQEEELIKWIPRLIQRLKIVKKTISRDVNLWVNSILEGCII